MVISKRAPAAAASGAGKTIQCFDGVNDVPCVAAGVAHDFAENWRSVDDLDLRPFSLGGPGTYPAQLASLDALDELIALAHRQPILVREVVPCLHLCFGQRAIGEPREVFDQLVVLEGSRLAG